ncbi:MAG: hypothetical protein HQM13_08000 [SAR324 cluster bacterium]|nr:hypothetical protein [SAR324 cluster bacterium]
MVYAGIFLIGAIGGLACAKIMLFLTTSENARNYPLGGFAPAVLIIFDLGQNSAVLGGGILAMGGLFGYYLLVSVWAKYMDKAPALPVKEKPPVSAGTSLKDYLT